jgi:hypothetical protein
MVIELVYMFPCYIKYSIFIILCIGKLSSQITFSEIMFDVATDEYNDEFVEIFNLSENDSFDLNGCMFSDGSGVDYLLPGWGGSKLAPQSFALILDSSYFEQSAELQVYNNIIPEGVVVFKISDRSFGSGGLSNSYDENLSIVDARGDTLTVYRYSTGNIPGHSDEKIILTGENSGDNWQDSRVLGGTPGFYNSVSPYRIDPGFSQTSLQIPYLIFEHDTIDIQLTIYNFGIDSINDTLSISLFSDRNENLQYDKGDLLIGNRRVYYPGNDECLTTAFQWNNIPAARHILVASLDLPSDENRENNILVQDINVLIRRLTVHVNEIKFLAGDNESEWIELINSGTEKIYLKGWGITDGRDTVIVDSSVYLHPEQMKVISTNNVANKYGIEDTLVVILNHFIKLNDLEDEIFLLEPGGGWKEHIVYSKKWLEGYDSRNVSLERINPNLYENHRENWGPCVSVYGGTPGKSNSIFAPLTDRKERINADPNPFSPDGDGFEDITIISGELPETSARIKVQIFDIRGRLIRTLKDNSFSGSRFNVVWDGKDTHGTMARMGIYIIFVQALNERKGVIREIKSTVVLAHKL